MDPSRTPVWAEQLKALAHPARLMILSELLKGMKCVNGIRELLEVRQPNVSQHLTVLKHGGLVGSCRDGAFRCYYLTRPALVRALFDFLGRDYPTVRPSEKEVRRVREKRARSSAARAAGARKRARSAR